MYLRLQQFHNLIHAGFCVARFFQMRVILRFVQDREHDCDANNWLVWQMPRGLRAQYLVVVGCGNQIKHSISITHLSTPNEQRKSNCNKEHDSMTSLYDWTEVINKECNYEQKCMIIGFMWDIAFIDSTIDKYEDFTIRKVADLIYVKHKDFIALKNDRAT